MITYIQLFIFVLYITYIIHNFGIPGSISETWYKLENNRKGLGILFTLFLWSIGFLMFFQTNGSTGFFFASGAGLIFTGAAAQYRQKMTNYVHFAGATSGLLFPLIGVWYERGVWEVTIIAAIITLVSFFVNIKNETFWLEVFVILPILIGLLS